MNSNFKKIILNNIDEACENGARLKACSEILEIPLRTIDRWNHNHEDQRKGPKSEPANKLTKQEREKIIEIAKSKKYQDLPPGKIIPSLADRGIYLRSESSFYRILKEEKMLDQRGKSSPATKSKPKPLEAFSPN